MNCYFFLNELYFYCILSRKISSGWKIYCQRKIGLRFLKPVFLYIPVDYFMVNLIFTKLQLIASLLLKKDTNLISMCHVYGACLRLFLMYCSETWAQTKAIFSSPKSDDMKALRRIDCVKQDESSDCLDQMLWKNLLSSLK